MGVLFTFRRCCGLVPGSGGKGAILIGEFKFWLKLGAMGEANSWVLPGGAGNGTA